MPALFSLPIGRFRKSFRFNGGGQNSSRAAKYIEKYIRSRVKMDKKHGVTRERRESDAGSDRRRIYETRVSARP